ncbi:MAG: isochorismatase family protein [Gammaproteobacteria bacterium]
MNTIISSQIQLQSGDALIIVDLQNDFLPGGHLAVPGGEQVIPVINGYIVKFQEYALPIYATRDWHPSNHFSFSKQGGPWPQHCVARSKGAEFAPDLLLPETAQIVSTGTDRNLDGYSGFEATCLHSHLEHARIKRLFIGGLATDYCVLHTVRDALQYCYQVFLLQDATRAVNVNPEDGDNAEREMIADGAEPITLDMIV